MGPALDKLGVGREAHEIEALEMIRQGFEELGESSPALGWEVVKELLGRISESVSLLFSAD